MELSNHNQPLQPWAQLSQAVRHFFEPFIHQRPDDDEAASMVMPLKQLSTLLNQHYLKQTVAYLTFEQYNQHNRLQLMTLPVLVQSPVQPHQHIKVLNLTSDQILDLSLNQILSLQDESFTLATKKLASH